MNDFFQQFQPPNPDGATYVLELSKRELLVVAQMTHMYQMARPKSVVAPKLLKSLIDQTDFVVNDPRKHKVYEIVSSQITEKSILEKFPTLYYVPADR